VVAVVRRSLEQVLTAALPPSAAEELSSPRSHCTPAGDQAHPSRPLPPRPQASRPRHDDPPPNPSAAAIHPTSVADLGRI